MKLLDDMFALLSRSVAHVDDIPCAQYCGVCRGRIDPYGKGHTAECEFVAIAKRFAQAKAREKARKKR